MKTTPKKPLIDIAINVKVYFITFSLKIKYYLLGIIKYIKYIQSRKYSLKNNKKPIDFYIESVKIIGN